MRKGSGDHGQRVASIYEVPLVLAHEQVDKLALKYLRIDAREPDLSRWEDLIHRVYNPKDEVTIGIVGKYVEYEELLQVR